MLTGGQLAALIVAVFWAILVSFLVYAIVRLTRLLTETTKIVSQLGERVEPLLDDMARTVAEAGEQLGHVQTINVNLTRITANTAIMTGLLRMAVATPLVKLAALGHGVRYALALRATSRALEGRTRR